MQQIPSKMDECTVDMISPWTFDSQVKKNGLVSKVWTPFRWDVSLLNKHAMIPTYQIVTIRSINLRTKRTYSWNILRMQTKNMCLWRKSFHMYMLGHPMFLCSVWLSVGNFWKTEQLIFLGLPLRCGWCDVASSPPRMLRYILLYCIKYGEFSK